MAFQGSLVRVDRGDGNLIKLTKAEADKFVAANAGARVVSTPGAVSDDVEMPEPPAAVLSVVEGTVEEIDLSELTVAELKAKADELGIDLGGATRKDDIIAAIEASSGEVEAGEEQPE